MICPRCDSDNVGLLVKSSVDEAWEVYKCSTCYFTWRSTEPDDIKDPEKYDIRFKIKPAKIPELSIIPPIPKLVK
jgi:vanillate/4-hydroxybenzoate decarboxylase subunit D